MKRKKRKRIIGRLPWRSSGSPNAGGTTSNPDGKRKIPSATWHDQKNKKEPLKDTSQKSAQSD